MRLALTLFRLLGPYLEWGFKTACVDTEDWEQMVRWIGPQSQQGA